MGLPPFYEVIPEKASAAFEDSPLKTVTVLFHKGNPAGLGRLAPHVDHLL